MEKEAYNHFEVFDMALLQLQKEKRAKIRQGYTNVDILDYAVRIRDFEIQQRINREKANKRWHN